MDYTYLEENLRAVRAKMAEAAHRAGRTGEPPVTLMVASKSGSVEEINYLHDTLGIDDIGENRVQQLLSRYDALHKEGLRIHFIGHLQTNKVKYIVDKVYMIHSLDSEKLAAQISDHAEKRGIVMRVLVEINSGNEESKSGVPPQAAEALCASLAGYPGIELCGFMTMAPRLENKEEYRGYFEGVAKLGRTIWAKLGKTEPMILSMGMSESYPEAIESGATLVRVGRRMFEKKEK